MTAADRGPNQGTIFQIATGEWVFVTHHGTPQWEGRPASLLPVTWVNGWPEAGRVGADGIGNMVWSGSKPTTGGPITAPEGDDDFSNATLSPQWEWYFQPRAAMWSLSERPGYLRMRAFKSLQPGNLGTVGNMLTLRPLRFADNTATVKMDITNMADGQSAGFGFFGSTDGTIRVSQATGKRTLQVDAAGTVTPGPTIAGGTSVVWLRSSWNAAGAATFQFSQDGTSFTPLGGSFQITDVGSFLGAKLVVYTVNDAQEAGYVDLDSFQYPCAR